MTAARAARGGQRGGAAAPRRFAHPAAGNQATGFSMEGDIVGAIGPYFAAIQEFIAILREARSGPTPARAVADVDREFDTAVGRYVYIRVDGVQYRVYYEEAGTGPIPMV